MDAGDFAEELASILEGSDWIKAQKEFGNEWTIVALDVGEIQITTGDGEKFELSILKVEAFDDDEPLGFNPASGAEYDGMD